MQKMHEPIPEERIAKNLATVCARVAEAAAKVSRALDSIRLLAVTKYVETDAMLALKNLGVTEFGESRVQDVERKRKALGDAANGMNWHLIGHLQTNKADKAVKIFQQVHSIDSDRVAQALNKERGKANLPPLSCLLEVNVAGEANKTGLAPDVEQLATLLKLCATLPHLNVTGLMCMAPYSETPEPTSRPVFKKLRELRDELNVRKIYPHALTELSMGMTQDYDIAIEEGATIVRVGSALFE